MDVISGDAEVDRLYGEADNDDLSAARTPTGARVGPTGTPRTAPARP